MPLAAAMPSNAVRRPPSQVVARAAVRGSLEEERGRGEAVTPAPAASVMGFATCAQAQIWKPLLHLELAGAHEF